MKSKILNDGPERTIAVVFDTGDEVMSLLERLALEQAYKASHFTGIGAFQEVTLGYFDWQRRQYQRIPIREQVEVLSLVGDVTLHESEPRVHAHVVVGRRDGTAHGGHLLEAHVRPTLELILIESPGYLRRTMDPNAHIPLIDLS